VSGSRILRVRFACVSDGALPIFDPQATPIYKYDAERHGWHPIGGLKNVIVNLDDICPSCSLKPHEYRVYNEHIIQRAARLVCGDGILTFVYRGKWAWHYALLWTLEPLVGQRCSAKAPSWWGAEDLWAEVGSFGELSARIDAEEYQAAIAWERVQVRARESVLLAREELGEEASDQAIENRAAQIMGRQPHRIETREEIAARREDFRRRLHEAIHRNPVLGPVLRERQQDVPVFDEQQRADLRAIDPNYAG
jgi:hypothetical protein